jgi:hypothetical protein
MSTLRTRAVAKRASFTIWAALFIASPDPAVDRVVVDGVVVDGVVVDGAVVDGAVVDGTVVAVGSWRLYSYWACASSQQNGSFGTFS